MNKQILFLVMVFLHSFCNGQSDKFVKNFDKFKQYYSLLNYHYLDSIDFDKIIESAIVKSLENLDPHSTYLVPKVASSETERLKGNFEGIGISFNVIKDTLNIMDVISGGPSEKVGLSIGDKLIKIDDTLFAGLPKTNDDYISKLKGKKGTLVKLNVLRDDKYLDFEIVRDIIPLHSIDVVTVLENEIGYIKLNKFSNTTQQELEEALITLKSKNIKSLILDLQNNSGGVLSASVNVCDEFLDPKKLVVYTKGLHYPTQNHETTDSGLYRKGKLIILINEYSASASEITAGAIQDWDRGLIVGRRSFGKGLVQKPFNLIDNSQLRLTIAEYFTPSGRCIQKSYKDGNKTYREDLIHRAQMGLLTKQDTFTFSDSLMKFTNNKRKVFGAGGITPDIYVPIDTSMVNKYYIELVRKGIIWKKALEYKDQNKKELLEKYPDDEKFKNSFEVDENIVNKIYIEADSMKIERDSVMIKNCQSMLRTVFKANLAKYLYGNTSFYKIIYTIDPIIKKAIELTKQDFKKYKVRNN